MAPSTRARPAESEDEVLAPLPPPIDPAPEETSSVTVTPAAPVATAAPDPPALVNESSGNEDPAYLRARERGLTYTYEEWKNELNASNYVKDRIKTETSNNQYREKMALQKLPIPEFNGEKDYIVVQNYLRKFTDYCTSFKYTSGSNVTMTISATLKGSADIWWNALTIDKEDMDVKAYCELIRETFVPGNPVIEASRRFANLNMDFHKVRESTKEVHNAVTLFNEKELSREEIVTALFYALYVPVDVRERMNMDTALKNQSNMDEAIVSAMQKLDELNNGHYTPSNSYRNKQVASGRVSKPFHSKNSQGRNNFGTNRQPNKNRETRECNYCHRQGHIEVNCRTKAWKEKSKNGKDQH
ncbi:hypothetical protein B5S32_g281 [[Candida] boidinii]|nr:hypothetical protein B5S32_g281 [[Candida] boidinii]